MPAFSKVANGQDRSYLDPALVAAVKHSMKTSKVSPAAQPINLVLFADAVSVELSPVLDLLTDNVLGSDSTSCRLSVIPPQWRQSPDLRNVRTLLNVMKHYYPRFSPLLRVDKHILLECSRFFNTAYHSSHLSENSQHVIGPMVRCLVILQWEASKSVQQDASASIQRILSVFHTLPLTVSKCSSQCTPCRHHLPPSRVCFWHTLCKFCHCHTPKEEHALPQPQQPLPQHPHLQPHVPTPPQLPPRPQPQPSHPQPAQPLPQNSLLSQHQPWSQLRISYPANFLSELTKSTLFIRCYQATVIGINPRPKSQALPPATKPAPAPVPVLVPVPVPVPAPVPVPQRKPKATKTVKELLQDFERKCALPPTPKLQNVSNMQEECILCCCQVVSQKLGCGHLFCSGCIHRWLLVSASCPTCRAPV